MTTPHVGCAIVLAFSACTTSQIHEPGNIPPTVIIQSPDPNDGALPLDTDIVIEAIVQDLDNLATQLTAGFLIGDDVIDNVTPDDFGRVSFDWRTPDTQGPIEVRVCAVDRGGLAGCDSETFWIE